MIKATEDSACTFQAINELLGDDVGLLQLNELLGDDVGLLQRRHFPRPHQTDLNLKGGLGPSVGKHRACHRYNCKPWTGCETTERRLHMRIEGGWKVRSSHGQAGI